MITEVRCISRKLFSVFLSHVVSVMTHSHSFAGKACRRLNKKWWVLLQTAGVMVTPENTLKGGTLERLGISIEHE